MLTEPINAPPGDVSWLYSEPHKSLSFQITQISEAFHFVSSIIINLSFFLSPGLAVLQAKARLGQPGKRPVFCCLFPEWAQHLE